MRLAEQGMINLNAPVDRYLTRWHLPTSAFAKEVTIRQLLSHSGGLPEVGPEGEPAGRGVLLPSPPLGDE